MQRERTSFISTKTLTTWLIALLSFYILILTIMVVFRISELELIRDIQTGQSISDTDAATSDSRLETIAIFRFLVLIATGIVFLVWKNKSYKNLYALGAKGLEYSSGWAVGSYFVPILCIFRPFQIMREIWKASNPKYDIGNVSSGTEWKNSSSSALLRLWWTLFIIDAAMSQASYGASKQLKTATTLDKIYDASFSFLVYDLTSISLTISAILLVKVINKRQELKYSEQHKFLYAKPTSRYEPNPNFRKRKYENIEAYEEIDEALIDEKDKPRIYGAVLGLQGRVSKQDIIDAYKNLITKYHPDKVSHLGIEFQRYAEKRTKDINKAYSYLKKKFDI